MNEKSRMTNFWFNLTGGFVYRIVIMCTAFVVRTVFIRCLSVDYLSVNGLYSSVLTMLSLAELGFGTAMVYSMYQPLANKDYKKLQQLMTLYQKAYRVIGTVILLLGISLIPFLDKLIKDKPNLDNLTFYYVLFLGDTVISYWFFAYRNSILQADQKAHVISKYSSIFNLIKSCVQVVFLITFKNYTCYLIIQIGCTIVQNICLAIVVEKQYPIFKNQSSEKLSREESHKIFKDVQALMLSRISNVILYGTDNIIISAFVGVKWIGLLSNYQMISEAITGILTQITGAMHASLGNFFAKENKEAGYQLFLKVDFLNFWLYGFSMISLITLLNPFVQLWLGEQFVLEQRIIVALAINFFVAGFMNTLWTFRSTLGLFIQGKYRSLIVSALNIVFSIGLSKVLGVSGVLFATAISRACVNLWYDPWLLHRVGFEMPIKRFVLIYVKRIFILIVGVLLMDTIKGILLINGVHLGAFVILMLVTGILPNLLFFISFNQSDECKYLIGELQRVKRKIVSRKKVEE